MQLRQDFEKLHLRSTFPSLNRQVTNEMPTGSLGFQKCLNIGIANLEGGGGGNLRISYCNSQYLSLLSMKLQLWKLPQIAQCRSLARKFRHCHLYEQVSAMIIHWKKSGRQNLEVLCNNSHEENSDDEKTNKTELQLKWSFIQGNIETDVDLMSLNLVHMKSLDLGAYEFLGFSADGVDGPWCIWSPWIWCIWSPWTLMQMKMEKCRLCRVWDPYCTWCI